MKPILITTSLLVGVLWAHQAIVPTPPETNQHTKPTAEQMTQLKMKAEAGDAAAQLALGLAYEDGNGVASSDELAVSWYRRAAEQGNSVAQNNLGLMYRSGRGVAKNKEEAVRWYQKAARQKSPQGMFNMGAAYYNGDGLPADQSAAYAWFWLAQEAGNGGAVEAVKRMTAELRPFEILEAERKIGDMFAGGIDLAQNYGEAAKWYGKTAQRNDAQSQISLATLLIDGRGIAQDYAEAKHWCEAASKQDYAPGPYCLGYLYQRGLGVKQDSHQAVKWYAKAAELNHDRAASTLAQMYWKGEGVKIDKPAAYLWLYRASAIKVAGAKQQARMLWNEMNKEEMARADKKFKEQRLDPKRVHEFMEAPEGEAQVGKGRRLHKD